MNILSIHLLGDLPSPVLVGQVLKTTRLIYGDYIQQYVLSGMVGLLLICAFFFFLAGRFYARHGRQSSTSQRIWEDEDDFFGDTE